MAAAQELSRLLRERGQHITTIESCTGGLVGAALTTLAGSSDVYPGGFITYSDDLKSECVGVKPETLATHGAVSSQTAIEMARGGGARTQAHYAISITGIAGPSGGSDEKPVGTVWICVASPDTQIDCRRFVFPGDRHQIRESSAIISLQMAIQMIKHRPETLKHEHERIEA